jgi:alkylation response protein AidB-like acyl-CoA dehydrogenase
MTFGGTAAIVGAFSVGLMRAAFDEAPRFARSERRAGSVPIIDHQAVGDLLTDVKTRIEAVRSLGIQSYAHDLPFGRILQDALAYPLFDGGNMGVRRRQLHPMLRDPGYDPLATITR